MDYANDSRNGSGFVDADELTAIDHIDRAVSPGGMVEQAIAALDYGMHPFPIGSGANGKQSLVKWKGIQTRQPAVEELLEWQETFGDRIQGWAFATGAAAGIVVLDGDGAQGLATLEALGLPIDLRTPNGGGHSYFRHPGSGVKVKSRARIDQGLWPNLDVRGDGGLVVAIGPGREWLDLERFEPTPWEELPAHLRDALVSSEPNARQKPIGGTGKILDGLRNDTLSREAFRLKKQGFDVETIADVLRALNGACDPPLDDNELREIARGKRNIAAKTSAQDEDAWTGPVPGGAELLDEIEAFLRRYMVMTDEEFTVAALYIVLTYAFHLVEAVPYLRVFSATKRCGKSRLLDVLEMVVRNPLPSGGLSESALFRSLAAKPRTLLFDEIGRVLGEAQRDKESNLTRVLLNGNVVGHPVQRCVGQGTHQKVEDFEVYAPKVLAGTGQLEDQILDRCLPIELRRKKQGESVERFRRRDVTAAGAQLRPQVAAWVEAHADELRNARPLLPDELDDRGQDICEPLLAVADLAGTEWAKRSRLACVALRGGGNEIEEDIGVELLTDIQKAFEADARLTTDDLLHRLTSDPERPWAHWSKGSPMNARQLSSRLRPFGVKPKVLRFDAGTTARGYELAAFEDVFSRYLPPNASLSVTPVTLAQPSQKQAVSIRNTEKDVTDAELAEKRMVEPTNAEVTPATDRNPHEEEKREDGGSQRWPTPSTPALDVFRVAPEVLAAA